MSSVPTGVLAGSLQRDELAETCLEDEPLLLALPEEIFVLLGEGTQVNILIGLLVDDIFRVHLHSLAVSEQAGPHGGPVGVEDFLLGHVGAA